MAVWFMTAIVWSSFRNWSDGCAFAVASPCALSPSTPCSALRPLIYFCFRGVGQARVWLGRSRIGLRGSDRFPALRPRRSPPFLRNSICFPFSFLGVSLHRFFPIHVQLKGLRAAQGNPSTFKHEFMSGFATLTSGMIYLKACLVGSSE